MTAISKPITKPIKISWIAPNGRQYKDTVNMTLEQYEKFVNKLLDIKQNGTEVSREKN